VIRIAVVAALLVALVVAAVVYERRARRVTHRRAATGAELRASRQPAGRFAQGLDPSVVARGFSTRPTDAPVVQQALDQVTREALAGATGRVGRHRRDMPVVPTPVTMTGFMRRLDADAVAADARMRHAVALETGELPAVRS
jgi:hypothetical protein